MDRAITAILTDGEVRTPEAVETLIAEAINSAAEPWLTVSKE